MHPGFQMCPFISILRNVLLTSFNNTAKCLHNKFRLPSLWYDAKMTNSGLFFNKLHGWIQRPCTYLSNTWKSKYLFPYSDWPTHVHIDCTDTCSSRENNQRNAKSLMTKLFPTLWQSQSPKRYGVQQYKWIWVLRPWMDNAINLVKSA